MLANFEDSCVAFRRYSTSDLKIARILFDVIKYPVITKIGISITKASMALDLPIETIIKRTLFRQFCGGTSLKEAGLTAQNLRQFDVQVILDYGVESKGNEEEFENNVLNLTEAVSYASEKGIPFISVKVTALARFKLLEHIHNKAALSDAEYSEWQKVEQRMDRICLAAAHKKVKVLIDAEETWIQEAVNSLTEKMMERFNKSEVVVYNTFQMYTRGAVSYLKECIAIARKKNYLLGVKIVRGAYMEKERRRAEKYGYPDPIQVDKTSTDKDFDEATDFCMNNLDSLHLFIGTHNEASCLKAIALMEQLNIPTNSDRVYFSQLYGMSDNISFNLAQNGYRVAKYLPYGPVEDVIPYLMRRAQENTSVAGQSGRELMLITKELKRRKTEKPI